MNKMIVALKLGIALLVTIILFSSCEKGVYLNSVEDAFNQARKEGKKVFVIVSLPNCDNCDDYLSFLEKDNYRSEKFKNEYVCCKTFAGDVKAKEFTMLTGAPFYPYSCFFTSEGELEGFHFGNLPFDINCATNNKIDDYRYRELFRYKGSYEEYREMISYSMKAWLCQSKDIHGSHDMNKSFELIKKSIEIFPNCGNLSLAYQISKRIKHSDKESLAQHLEHIYTPINKIIYGDFYKENNLEMQDKKGRKELLNNEEYTVNTNHVKCGKLKLKSKFTFEYKIQNNKQEPLLIQNVRKGCGCIDLEWDYKPILPGETGVIKCIYTAQKKGKFHRQIYVHIQSKNNPMKQLLISGEVIDIKNN